MRSNTVLDVCAMQLNMFTITNDTLIYRRRKKNSVREHESE